MRRKSGQEKMWRKVCGEKVEKKCGENLDRRPGQEKSVKSGQETVDFLQTRIANNERSRRSSKARSTSWRSGLIAPTRPTTKVLRQSRGTRSG